MAKVSIQDIAKAIVNKHGLSQSEAENFVTVLFDVLNEGLHKEKIVKVKGLGTFKVIDVRERESVNVNTGERVLIDSHGKITFTPDPVMRDLVNKPFAQFETVILNDGVDLEEMSNTQGYANDGYTESANINDKFDKTEETADEKNNSVQETNDTFIENTIETDKIQDNFNEPKANTATPIMQPEEVTEENETEQHDIDLIKEEEQYDESSIIKKEEELKTIFHQETLQNNECKDNDDTTEPQDKIHVIENSNNNIDSPITDYAEEKRKIAQTQWGMFLIFTLLFGAITLIIGYYWGVSSVGPIIRYKTVHILNEPISTTVEKDTLHIIDTTSTKKVTTSPQKEKIKVNSEQPKATTDINTPALEAARTMVRTGAYKIIGTAETITVKKGETLKKISKFYLGEGMECYIQTHNGITEVKEGMRLKIPKLQIKKK